MQCNGMCAFCQNHYVVVTDQYFLRDEPTEKPVVQTESVVETEPVEETGLVVSDNLPESIGEFTVTKNIFGKEVVKRIK